MSKEIVDIILVAVQVATFIAVAVYVWKTSQMAKSTKELVSAAQKSAEASIISARAAEDTVKELVEARDQETAPYIVAYFEVKKGSPFIYLIITNIGRTVAHNVKVAFSPPLRSSTEGIDLNTMPAFTEGISSIPPRFEIRTFFDSAISLFGDEKVPLIYQATISYHGGLKKDERAYEMLLDLQSFRGLMYGQERDIDDLVKQLEKLVTHSSNTNERLSDIASGLKEGLWLRNQEFIVRDFSLGRDAWTGYAVAKLREFRAFWFLIKETEQFIPPSRIQTKCKFIADQISIIGANSPTSIPEDITAGLLSITIKLSELGNRTLFIGRKNSEEFESAGNKIIEQIEAVITQLESKKPTQLLESENPTDSME